jgi:glutaconate CoA-transferase, subunit B
MTSANMSTEYTANEQMVVSAARQIRDRDVVYVGVGLPMQAGLLAKRLYAPNCTIIIENGIVRSDAFPLPNGTDTLGSQSFSDQLSGLFHVMCLGQAGHITTGFLGAGQVDRYGNANDTCAGDYLKPSHRWPGSGGGNDIMSFCARTVVVLEQKKIRFPERVDFNTCPGYYDGKAGRREDEGLRPGTGPSAVITDLAEYMFVGRELTVKSVHEGVGVTLDKVKSEVGWDIKFSPTVSATLAPTREELETLRRWVKPMIPPTDAGPRPANSEK